MDRERAEILADLRRIDAWPAILAEVEPRMTTAQLRRLLDGSKAQIAFYQERGIEDMAAAPPDCGT
jgi:hypothetical protein